MPSGDNQYRSIIVTMDVPNNITNHCDVIIMHCDITMDVPNNITTHFDVMVCVHGKYYNTL